MRCGPPGPIWALQGGSKSLNIWNYYVYCDLGPPRESCGTTSSKNIRNYNVYCDVGHKFTQKLNKTDGFLTFLRCGPPGDPRSPQGPPRSPPRSPQGRPWNSQCLPKSPQELSETSSRDKRYINKLRINRPSGRLVLI